MLVVLVVFFGCVFLVFMDGRVRELDFSLVAFRFGLFSDLRAKKGATFRIVVLLS